MNDFTNQCVLIIFQKIVSLTLTKKFVGLHALLREGFKLKIMIGNQTKGCDPVKPDVSCVALERFFGKKERGPAAVVPNVRR